MSVVESTELDEVRARLARLEQTQAAGQGGTFPHTGILAGIAPHTVLGPVGDDGRVLPGAWNVETGLWENPEEAAANAAKKAEDQAAAVEAARQQLAAANEARAIEVARQQLAEEGAFAAEVERQKAILAGGAPADPNAPPA